jgi:hypothetical protein
MGSSARRTGRVYGLTPDQRRLADRVCGLATGLTERLRLLGQATHAGADPSDVERVRGWLFATHGGRERECDA